MPRTRSSYRKPLSSQSPLCRPKHKLSTRKQCLLDDKTRSCDSVSDIKKRKSSSSDVAVKCRSCDKPSCQKKPTCFARATDRCTGSGYTVRWYHISYGEHFCNDCFDHFYRSNRVGYQQFMEWKCIWSTNGKTEANVITFLTDQYLPYWLQCTSCKKWRQLPRGADVTSDLIRTFKCKSNLEINGKFGCDANEDKLVSFVRTPTWIGMLRKPKFPGHTCYRLDGLGVNASDQPVAVPGVPSCVRPFHLASGDQFPHALFPDSMTSDEKKHFPQYVGAELIYLAIRNIVISLWALNSKEVLTADRCVPHIICRGLVRIRCLSELPSVIRYLTCAKYINIGVDSGSLLSDIVFEIDDVEDEETDYNTDESCLVLKQPKSQSSVNKDNVDASPAVQRLSTKRPFVKLTRPSPGVLSRCFKKEKLSSELEIIPFVQTALVDVDAQPEKTVETWVKDDDNIFGQFVVSEMRKITDENTKLQLKQTITNALFSARITPGAPCPPTQPSSFAWHFPQRIPLYPHFP